MSAWEIEESPDTLARLPADSLVQLASDVVIPVTRYTDLLTSVEDRLVDLKHDLLPVASDFEGITEISLGKQSMWKLDLATELRADQLMIGEDSHRTLTNFLTQLARSELSRYENFEERILEQMVAGLALPDLALLSPDEIERCRRLMPAFRRKFEEKHAGRYREVGLADLITEIAESIVDEFQDILISRGRQSELRPIGREMAWDLLEFAVAPVIALKYAVLLSRLRRDSDDYGLLLLLLRQNRQRSRTRRR